MFGRPTSVDTPLPGFLQIFEGREPGLYEREEILGGNFYPFPALFG